MLLDYYVIPNMYPKMKEGVVRFRFLHMYRCCQCFRLLDTPPSLMKSAIVKAPPLEGKGFSQYEAVFLQLADEHRTVNAFELQELLEACLPNGTMCFFIVKYVENLIKSRIH